MDFNCYFLIQYQEVVSGYNYNHTNLDKYKMVWGRFKAHVIAGQWVLLAITFEAAPVGPSTYYLLT